MAAPFDQKQAPTATESDSGSSRATKNARPEYGSSEDHPFSDTKSAEHWRSIYEKAKFEGRHRFDPNYTWTAEEEKRLVRKVRILPHKQNIH